MDACICQHIIFHADKIPVQIEDYYWRRVECIHSITGMTGQSIYSRSTKASIPYQFQRTNRGCAKLPLFFCLLVHRCGLSASLFKIHELYGDACASAVSLLLCFFYYIQEYAVGRKHRCARTIHLRSSTEKQILMRRSFRYCFPSVHKGTT